jgi:lipopolysaccharide/colanic/teichoic acid biosynthesis glycosyltransferase
VVEFLLGLLGNMLAAEIGEWLPKLSLYILKHSLSRVPPELSDRLSEEWHAVLTDTPGGISKLRCAMGFLLASPRIRHEFYLPNEPFKPISFGIIRLFDVTLSLVSLLLLTPLLVLLAVLIRITTGGPILTSDIRFRNDGTTFHRYEFNVYSDSEKSQEMGLSAVGSFLKRTALYALPLWYNVLVGDLSLVGTKPNRQFEHSWHRASSLGQSNTQVRPGLASLDSRQIREFLKNPLINYFRVLKNTVRAVLFENGRPDNLL